MNCCKNYIGSFPHNENIDTGINPLVSGVYTFEFTGINGTKLKITQNITVSDTPQTLVIPKGILNESMFYCVTIKDPNGELLVDANDCPNYCFDTYISTNTTCGNTCEPPAEDIGPVI